MDALLEQIGGILAGIFDSPIVRVATFGFVAYVALLWLASAYWVFQDMRRRHRDPMLPYVAAGGVVVASPVLFPLALVVYWIIRPGETLAEARERELTEQLEALEAEFALACPGCGRSVEEAWLACPSCRTKLAHRCANCGRTMGLDWSLCGWCGAEFGQGVLPERLPLPERSRAALGPARGVPTGRDARAAAVSRALEPGA